MQKKILEVGKRVSKTMGRVTSDSRGNGEDDKKEYVIREEGLIF